MLTTNDRVELLVADLAAFSNRPIEETRRAVVLALTDTTPPLRKLWFSSPDLWLLRDRLCR